MTMSVKDNRMKCDWCGLPTNERDRAKVVLQKKSGEESCHFEAHRGKCLANLLVTLANGEVGAGEAPEPEPSQSSNPADVVRPDFYINRL